MKAPLPSNEPARLRALHLPADKNRRVLVIDDNRAIHDDFRKILSPAPATAAALDVTETALFGRPADAVPKTQFEVDSAYQGQEGVLLVEQALEAGLPYAMAFVDVRMPPGWDGVETTRRIWERDPDLQVVLCTAYSDYSWDEMFDRLGHRDGLLILKKPFDAVEAFQLAHALTEKWWLHQLSRRKMEELESRVAERTHELQHINHALHTEVAEHQRAEGRLRESEEKFRQLADNVTDVFWMTSPDMQEVHYVSAAYEQVWGRSVESLYPNPYQWAEAILPEERERVYATFSRLAGDESNVSVEFPIARPDGTVRWIASRGFQVRDAAGRVIRITGIASDITERRRTEEALRLLSSAVEQANESIMITDAELDLPGPRIVFVNPAFTRMTGYIAEEAIGRTPRILQGPRTDGTALNRLRKNLERGEVFEGETINYRKDGKAFNLEWQVAPIRDAGGNITHFVTIQRDVTERKRWENAAQAAAEELRESERRFSDMLRNLELVSLMLDREARITYCNDFLLRVTGWQREEVLGRDWFELFIPPEIVDELRGVTSALLADQPVAWHHENEILTRSGARRLIRWNNSVLRSASGNVTGTASIGEDITERKRLEARLLESQKLETVGKLAGGVAHEFNSILTAIIGQSELILGDLPSGHPLSRNAAGIRQAAERAATLTRQLLAYGRKQFLQPEALDLNQVIANMEGVFHHLMGGDVDTHVVCSPNLQMVKADAGQIEQVIMNMVMNARDAMPNGGKLTLETANISFDQESAGGYPDLKPGDYVMLAITDTGAGMSEEVKARVFEPFFTTKGVGQGTGLGLSTCYGIIKQSGGDISVYSELARGATFKVYLPQVEPHPLQRRGSLDLPRGTETILLVEDDPALREMATTLLRQLGYSVLAAANGIEALSLKQQRGIGHIDLLFTDVVMPHMSGKELSERVQASYPHTKVLFTSASTENAIVHQGVLNKGVALLQKPFTPSALAHKLREVLDQPSDPKPDSPLDFTRVTKGEHAP